MLSKLKIYYKRVNKKLPDAFDFLQLILSCSTHRFPLRVNRLMIVPQTNLVFTETMLKVSIPETFNANPDIILDTAFRASKQTFCYMVKQHFLNQYETECNEPNCYSCNQLVKARTQPG